MRSHLGENDPKLSDYLLAPTESAATRALDRVMASQMDPIRQIVRSRRRGYQSGSQEAEDINDLYGSAVLDIVKRLRECKTDPEGAPVRDLSAYVGRVTARVCNDHLAKQRPHWGLAYTRLRSAARNNPKFRLTAFGGSSVCGMSRWPPGAPSDRDDPRLLELVRSPDAFAQKMFGNIEAEKLSPVELLAGFLSWLRQPVELKMLVLPACAIWKLDAMSFASHECEDYEQSTDHRLRISGLIVLRDLLARLWTEITKLPLAQRTAFLLNMQDAQQRGGIELFTVTSVTRLSEIAAAVDIPYAEFLELWGELPLSDQQLASRLGVTVMQVIGLRKSARERLGRFLKSIDRG